MGNWEFLTAVHSYPCAKMQWIDVDKLAATKETIMEKIDSVAIQIRNLPGSGVDVGIRQGYSALNEQRENPVDKSTIDKFTLWVEEIIADLMQRAHPLKIPSDYIYFLEYYGGLWIARDEYYFATFGLGPTAEVWYSSARSDAADPSAIEYGFIPVGVLSFRKSQREEQQINFYIDLQGSIQSGSILGIPLVKEKQLYPSQIIRNLTSYPNNWQIVSISFTDWLENAVKTQGTFGYLSSSISS